MSTLRFVAHDNGHRCYDSDNGIRRVYLGCRHETPRQAIAHTAPGPFVPASRRARHTPRTDAGGRGGGLTEAPQ